MKSKATNPPKIAQRFLYWFLRDDFAEEVQGDLDEQFFFKLQETSLFRARLNYWFEVFNYLRPFAIKKYRSNSSFFTMYQHNFKLTYRNFLRHKSSFFINLFGLSIGLACSLLIVLWVNDEFSMDKFYANDNRLYQVRENQQISGSVFTTQSTPWLLAEALAAEMPEVEYATVATPTVWYEKFTLQVNEKITKATGHYVGKDYFNVFSFALVDGNRNELLQDKNSIVISQELALRLFNTTVNLVGKAILFQQESEFFITGVIEDTPKNSSIKFDFALSIDLLKDSQPQAFSWENSGPNTFVVLKEGSNLKAFNQKISGLIASKSESGNRTPFLSKYSDSYLYGNYENGVQAGGRIEYVRFFSILAASILILACINFMNLSTARASRRIKEVGVKKAIGVKRSTLILQYLTESMVLAYLALAMAIVFVGLFLPQFNLIAEKQLTLQPEVNLTVAILVITTLTGLLAGSYPALYLSGFKPVTVLTSQVQGGAGELWVRKGLVIFQIAISVIFIVCVLIINRQIDFVQSQNLGYNKDNVIYFEIEGKVKENLETFLNELKNVPGVVSASSAGQSMIGGGNSGNIEWEGKNPNLITPFAFRPANFGLMEMLDLKILVGRTFSRELGDSLSVIFNQTGIELMALENPVGKTIQWGPLNCKIVGVVKDFHYQSLRSDIAPMFFILAPEHTEKVMARIEQGKSRQTLDLLQQFYQQYNPGFTFDYKFLDQDYQAQYKAEQRVSVLSGYFAVVAVIIACLGLFGLATFTAERRLKEIGIRKILGAGNFNIIHMLSNDFTKMVLVAILLALPASYLIMLFWLEGFAFKIPLQYWFFVGPASLALLITWLTVGMQTLKSANLNPVDCLRDE